MAAGADRPGAVGFLTAASICATGRRDLHSWSGHVGSARQRHTLLAHASTATSDWREPSCAARSAASSTSSPGSSPRPSRGSRSTPRVAAVAPEPRALGLGELERVRDELAEPGRRRPRGPRRARRAGDRATASCSSDMLARPADFKWLRISRADARRARLRPLALAPPLRAAGDADGLVAGEDLLRLPLMKPTPGDDRPPAPWGSFPLAELTILAGIVAARGRPLRRRPDRDRRSASPSPAWAGWRSRSASTWPATAPTRPCSPARSSSSSSPCSSTPPASSWRWPSASAPSPSSLAFLGLRRAFQRASGGLSFKVGRRGRLEARTPQTRTARRRRPRPSR